MADSITTAVQSEVAGLAHRHLSFSYALVGTLVLLLVLMGFGGYLGVKAFDAQLARQEVKDAQYQQDRKVFMDQLSAHDAERAAQQTQIAQLQSQIAKRDSQPLPKAVQAGLQVDAGAEQVKTALEAVYGADLSTGTPKVEPDGNIALSPSLAQKTVSAEVGLVQSTADLKDEKAIVSLQETSIGTLKTDLSSCTATLSKANSDIQGFKKLAVRSRWKKFLGGAEKVLIFGAGAYLGHKL
jgi:hypothetical protein